MLQESRTLLYLPVTYVVVTCIPSSSSEATLASASNGLGIDLNSVQLGLETVLHIPRATLITWQEVGARFKLTASESYNLITLQKYRRWPQINLSFSRFRIPVSDHAQHV